MMRELFTGLLLLALAFGGGYFYGKRVEVQAQQLEIERLNKEARAKEEALTSAVTTTANVLRSTNERAKLAIEKRNADIESGRIKLRVPIQATCPVSTAGDTGPAAGNSIQATAELDPTVAQRIVAITDQGDANTRQLNACIDAYNSVYQTLKGKP
jgi:prophage endopeptidase